MSLRVEITGDAGSVDVSILADVLAFGSHRVPECPAGDWELTLVLADLHQISTLHDQYFDDPSATDVISFPSGDDLYAAEGYLGDIVVSVDVATTQAEDEGHSLTRETAFLALHGLLHVCGHSDASDQERSAMLKTQTEILEAYEERFGVL